MGMKRQISSYEMLLREVRIGGEERRLMHLVPAPAERLMKLQLISALLSLSWDVTARHKNEEKNRQAVRFGQHTSSHFYLSCRLKPLEITVIEMYCPRI